MFICTTVYAPFSQLNLELPVIIVSPLVTVQALPIADVMAILETYTTNHFKRVSVGKWIHISGFVGGIDEDGGSCALAQPAQVQMPAGPTQPQDLVRLTLSWAHQIRVRRWWGVRGVVGSVLAKAESVGEGVGVDGGDDEEGGEVDGERGRHGKDLHKRGETYSSATPSLSRSSSASQQRLTAFWSV